MPNKYALTVFELWIYIIFHVHLKIKLFFYHLLSQKDVICLSITWCVLWSCHKGIIITVRESQWVTLVTMCRKFELSYSWPSDHEQIHGEHRILPKQEKEVGQAKRKPFEGGGESTVKQEVKFNSEWPQR